MGIMSKIFRGSMWFFSALVLCVVCFPILAAEGMAVPWQLNFQPAATPVMAKMHEFHDLLLIIIFSIGIFVALLVLYVAWRFREGKNKIPKKFSHNTTLEIIWTVIPVLILIVIAIPSFKLLYYMDHTEDADMTLKITSHQWYWNYEYPDHGNFGFDSYMIPDQELKPGQPRLLATDNPVVVPVGKNVRIIATSADVIHSWAVPAFGIKKDTVPGRINETWFRADYPGVFYGQCSELCGPKHGFMPIEVRVVTEEEFKAWVETARAKFS